MNSAEKRSPKVLLAPLDWGLGHATRCIPIIRALLAANCELHLAGNGRSLKLLKSEFPNLPSHELADYGVRYESKHLEWEMIKQSQQILNAIKQEATETEALQSIESFELIISDNRYGVHAKPAHNVFISHQLNIQVNGLWALAKPIINQQNKARIEQFDELWVPDWAGEKNISGDLSKTDGLDKIKLSHLGALSRFTAKTIRETKYKTISVLSGPEPQRSNFEKALLTQLPNILGNHLVVRGISESNSEIENGNIKLVDHLKTGELQSAFEESEIAISRSGYSSLMDYLVLGQKAILVATPGQTEQMYLSERMSQRPEFVSQKQNELDLALGLKQLEQRQEVPGLKGNELLEEVLTATINQLREKRIAKT